MIAMTNRMVLRKTILQVAETRILIEVLMKRRMALTIAEGARTKDQWTIY